MSRKATLRSVAADFDTHEKVCTERYGSLWTAIKELKEDLRDSNAAARDRDAVQHTRFNTISNRMWFAVAGVAGAAILGLCAMAFYMISRGFK